MEGKPWLDKLKSESYKDAIPEFKEALATIGKTQGWALSDMKARFLNDLFDKLLFDDVEDLKADIRVGNGKT